MFNLEIKLNNDFKNYNLFIKKKDFRRMYNFKINKNYTLKLFGYLNHKNNFNKIKKFTSKDVPLFKNNISGKYIGLVFYKNRLKYLFNDKYGEQQIFYKILKKKIIFSNQIDDFSTKNTFDQKSLASIIFTYGNYVLKKDTILNDVKRLSLDEYFFINKKKFKISKINFSPKNISNNFSTKHLHKYFKALKFSIKSRLSNNTNWIYLSSGYDSSSILAIIKKFSKKNKVRAVIGRLKYSNKFGYCNDYEIKRTIKIAKYFNIKLDIVNIDYTKTETLKELEENKKILRNNQIYTFLTNNFLFLAKYIKKKSKPGDVVFNGDISDGAHNFGFSQFATILSHNDLNYREYADKMMCYLYSPSFFKKVKKNNFTKDIIFKFLKDQKKIDIILKKKYSYFDFIAPLFLSSSRFPFSYLSFKKLIKKKKINYYKNFIYKNYFSSVFKGIKESNLYSIYLYLYNFFHWSSGTVFGISNVSEFLGIRTATPFWDQEIQKMLSIMPENYGRGLEMLPTKYPLKFALKNFIKYPLHLQTGPHSYLYDTGNWNVDVDLLYHSPLSRIFKRLLKSKIYTKIIDKTLIDLKYLDKLVKDYCNGVILKGEELNHLKGIAFLVFFETNHLNNL